jgi:two-component system phosphate regulon sensor histidine kinase PhoR
MLGVGLLASIVLTLLYDRSFGDNMREANWRELREQLRLLESLALNTLDSRDAAELQARLAGLGADGTRYTVIAVDGRVLADSSANPDTMENHAVRPEIAQARRDGEGEAWRYSATVEHELAYVARAIRRTDGSLAGIARVARRIEAVEKGIADNRRDLVLAAAISLAFAGALAWLLARGIARPVARLRSAALAMAEGEDRARAESDGGDEFGELGRALNAMADRLQERVEDMRRERAKMSAIIGGMVEGVAAVDASERILHLNGAAADMLGVVDEAAIGRPLIEVMRIAEIAETVAAILVYGEKASRELAIHKGGEARIVQLEAAPLRDREGAVIGAVLVLHDVTELRRLEAVRRDFVANVSHELKTPLTAIKGMVDTMVDDARMPEDVRQRFLDKIKRQSDRLAALVTDLLVLARIESSKGSEDLRPLDLRQPVRESGNQLAAAAQEKHLELRLSLPDAPVVVSGEAESLRQAVDNLLGNAIRYTPEQGEVKVSLVARGNEAVLTVQDTGIGIEARHIDRIFERFYRVDKARSRELGGTGLGLAIVKHVVLSHGGTVTVQSQPGQGSTFSVRLPLAAARTESRLVS